MEYIAAAGTMTAAAEADAAERLAALHALTAPTYGFAYDTVIGGLPQPNGPSTSWLDFFRDRRLLHMGRAARDAGRLPAATLARIETLAGRLDRWIVAVAPPALIHGDMWGGNILCRGGRIVAFIDPAIYDADPEIELAFATLFGTFGAGFFRRYGGLRPIAPGFFEERRDLYNLYPLLVHVRLFGGGYLGQLEHSLGKFGV
jgi:fructosamine-3-kinase